MKGRIAHAPFGGGSVAGGPGAGERNGTLMRTFFNRPGIVEAAVDETLDAIIVTWLNLSSAQMVRQCCSAQLEEVKRGVPAIIVDTSRAIGAPPPEAQDWLRDILFPALRDAGLRVIITVVACRPQTVLAANRWTSSGKPFEFEMIEAGSLATARRLAQTYARRAS